MFERLRKIPSKYKSYRAYIDEWGRTEQEQRLEHERTRRPVPNLPPKPPEPEA